MKKISLITSILIYGLLGSSYSSLASTESSGAVLFDKCKINIKTPKNSSGHYFAEDCSRVWVLPPKFGQVDISLVPDVQSYLCAAYDELKVHAAERNWSKVAEIDNLLTNKYAGQGVMHFTVSTNALIDQYIELNPSLEPSFFREMPINEGIISGPTITTFSPESTLTNKTVHEYDLGSKVAAEFFYGDKVPDEGLISLFKGSNVGQFILSPYGACEIIDSNTNQLKSTIDSSTLANRFAPAVYTSYDVKVGRKYSIKYNKSVLFKRLEKNITKRRLFSRKKIHELFIDQNEVEGLEIKVDSDSSDFKFEDDIVIKEIRKSFIDKLINEIAVPKEGAKSLGSVDGQTGADVIASELNKVCKHKYCKFASFGLKTLAEIFGTGSNSSNTEINFNSTITETYEEKQPVLRTSTTVFVSEDQLEERN